MPPAGLAISFSIAALRGLKHYHAIFSGSRRQRGASLSREPAECEEQVGD